ncbi:MAG: hypothetical protein RL154_1410 [Pseudomonadota bacterium]|jgi:hypothetical protein
MKKIVASLAIAACAAFAAPQLSLPNNVPELSIMASIAEKKAIVLANMNIQDAKQLAAFGSLYDEYQMKLFDLQIKRDEAVLFFAKNYETMTDAQAKEILAKWNTLREAKAKLISDYTPKFEKVLPATQALRYYQIESKLGTLADVKAAELIPLAKTPAPTPAAK